jgi:triacylglycerol lipase
VRDDATDRIGDVGNLRMEESLLDIDRVVGGHALPEQDDRYLVLGALGAPGEVGVNPELVQVIPETIGGRLLTVEPSADCPDGAVCNEAFYADDKTPVDDATASALVRGYKPTFYDPGEWSTYDLEVECLQGCTPRPAGKQRSTKYPVYYAHGFNSSKLTWAHLLKTHVSHVPGMDGWNDAENVDPFSPVAIRAEQLRRNLLALLQETEATEGVVAGERFLRVNVVAHSMGGLDSRFLVGAPRYNAECATSSCSDAEGNPESCCPPPDLEGNPTTWAERVASITTLSTPHCGSSFADLGVKALKHQLVHKGFEVVARKLFGLDEAGRELLAQTMYALSQEFCQKEMAPGFPAPNPARVYDFACAGGACKLPAGADAPPSDGQGGHLLPAPIAGTPTIFSWSGVACVSGSCGDVVDAALVPSYLWVDNHEGDNDGVVSVESARFGIYMGVLPHDHFDWTRTDAESRVEEIGGRLAGWLFGVRKEPAERFHLEWLDRLRAAGY